MTKKIPVASRENMFYASVDDSDYEAMSRLKWRAHVSGSTVYAIGFIGSKSVFMHRLIMGEPDGLMVDHKDGNGLNNVRSNLRLSTNSQNQANSRLRRTSRSGYKGVCLRGDKIAARIKFNGESIFLGYFKTAEEAARAYNRAAVQYYGEFARLNDVD